MARANCAGRPPCVRLRRQHRYFFFAGRSVTSSPLQRQPKASTFAHRDRSLLAHAPDSFLILALDTQFKSQVKFKLTTFGL
jgi:hypothetical protein